MANLGTPSRFPPEDKNCPLIGFLNSMKEIKIYQFLSYEYPLNERMAILDFKDQESDLIKEPVYKESFYCFLFMEKGEADLTVAGESAHIKAPMLITALPGDTWQWKRWKDIKGYFICFDAETLMSGLKGGYSLDPIPFLDPEDRYPFIHLTDRRFKRLKLLTEDMKDCLNEHPVYYDLLRAELWQFIFLAEKEYILNGNNGRKREQPNHLMNFIQLVNNNYVSHHDVKFYAHEMHITPNYLNKIVKSNLGISAFDYITNRIISEAKVLLRLTKINISQLSYRLGYENPNYFIRLFNKIEGITPLEYQKRGTL